MGNTEIFVTEIPRSAIPDFDMRLTEVTEHANEADREEAEAWGESDWVDLINSLTEDTSRFFILTWEGQRDPLGVTIMDRPITYLNDIEVFSIIPDGNETKVGYYKRIIDSAGPLGQKQQILIFAYDPKATR